MLHFFAAFAARDVVGPTFPESCPTTRSGSRKKCMSSVEGVRNMAVGFKGVAAEYGESDKTFKSSINECSERQKERMLYRIKLPGWGSEDVKAMIILRRRPSVYIKEPGLPHVRSRGILILATKSDHSEMSISTYCPGVAKRKPMNRLPECCRAPCGIDCFANHP